ncbi:MAG: L-2-hydroxyglutarate oxidase [Ignavibacteriaceae bacterium]
MSSKLYDIAIIGGGIVGTAAALQILKKKKLSLILIEAENKLAAHQTGRNSGVIHSGLYYKPGSLKASNCVEGRNLLYRFCEENQIKYEQCGKIVVAVNEDEIARLNELERRGRENGLKNIKRLSKDEIKNYEPHAAGIEGLFVGETGIVDYTEVTKAYEKTILSYEGEVKTGCKFLSLNKNKDELILNTSTEEIRTKFLINCGGLQSDRIAALCGLNTDVQIIPFRGEYYKIKKEKEYLVKNLIYPVPDPRFPFLGVHFTRMINGGIEAGPNAVLAFKREGYNFKDFSLKDISEMINFPGFWKMGRKYYKTGFHEFYRSLSKSAFVTALQKLVPGINEDDVTPYKAGVRAQAVDNNGNLLDDFRIIENDNMVHILNAPSPAATASLSIGEKIASLVIDKIN